MLSLQWIQLGRRHGNSHCPSFEHSSNTILCQADHALTDCSGRRNRNSTADSFAIPLAKNDARQSASDHCAQPAHGTTLRDNQVISVDVVASLRHSVCRCPIYEGPLVFSRNVYSAAFSSIDQSQVTGFQYNQPSDFLKENQNFYFESEFLTANSEIPFRCQNLRNVIQNF